MTFGEFFEQITKTRQVIVTFLNLDGDFFAENNFHEYINPEDISDAPTHIRFWLSNINQVDVSLTSLIEIRDDIYIKVPERDLLMIFSAPTNLTSFLAHN